MKMRTVEIKVRLTKREADKLNERVQRSGLSRESYVRQLLNGLVPTDAPPPDYHAFMRELHAIGNNLNQIAQKANANGIIESMRYDTNVEALTMAIVKITKAVMLPRRISREVYDDNAPALDDGENDGGGNTSEQGDGDTAQT